MGEVTLKDKDHELALAEQQLLALDDIPQWLKDSLIRAARSSSPKFWSPPDDPDKPRLPYLPGFATKIYRHHPERETSRSFIDLKDYLENVTQSEAIVANPVNETPVFSENETAQLTITGLIAVGEARGAQVVSCTVTLLNENGEAAGTFQAVAKIYDPLYYNFKSDIGNYPKDCAYDAYQEYKAETTAYEHLRKWEKSLEGAATSAKYYGSWIFWLLITINGKPQNRSIRLVLIEQLNGVSLEDMRVQNDHDKSIGTDSFRYPEEYRLEVLARVLDGYVRQFKTGLFHGDLAGRNVVLVPNDPQEVTISGLTMPRIVLIDYNNATFKEAPLEQAEGLPRNPGEHFWDLCLWDLFGGWVPNEWEDTDGQQQWLLERFVRSEHRDFYQPVSEYFLSRINSADSLPRYLIPNAICIDIAVRPSKPHHITFTNWRLVKLKLEGNTALSLNKSFRTAGTLKEYRMNNKLERLQYVYKHIASASYRTDMARKQRS